MKRSSFAWLASVFVLGACTSPSANDLTVTATIVNPAMTLAVPQNDPLCMAADGTPLCWTYSGVFELDLALGDLASTPSNVTVQQISILGVAEGAEKPIISSLDAVLSKTENVAIGQTVRDLATFKSTDLMMPTIDKTLHDQLCGGGGIVLSGNILDGARGSSVPFQSATFAVSGC
jgi:hypothetical protein